MKRLMILVITTTLGVILVGCCATTKELDRMSRSERTDVFTEVPAEGAAPAGFVDLVIKASIKTPLEGYYLLESKASVHGKPGYPFLVNIDGQAVLWKVDGQKEMVPRYDEKDKVSRDPEAGEGMKYVLEKKIRLAPGAHKVFFGLPGEPYYTIAEIFVKSGGLYILEFKPVYRYKTSPTRIPTFLKGVDKFEVMFKEIRVQDR